MSWIYEIATGRMRDPDSNLVGVGYSGQPQAKNDPARQAEHNVGPIPVGQYRLGPPIDTVTHGPHVIPLSPQVDNEMHGRDGFLVHGDSVVHPGTASKGCIIQSRDVREMLGRSQDKLLTVVSGLQASDIDGEIAT